MNYMKFLTISQSAALFGAGLVFPFYVIFINRIGANFTEFGIAYALFALSAALFHKFIGEYSDKLGRKIFLLFYSWGVAITFLIFPIVTSIYHVYVLQIILGILGAMQKTSEKALVADFTEKKSRGKQIGVYHGWTSIFAAISFVIGGYLIDLFNIEAIFYVGSVFLFLSGLLALKIKEGK